MSLMEKWNSLSRRARDKNLELDITPEYLQELIELQRNYCALSGRPIGFSEDKLDTASPDRKSSRLGYIRGNMQWVHKDFNRMKNDYEPEEFFKMCQEVIDYHRSSSDEMHTRALDGAEKPTSLPAMMTAELSSQEFTGDFQYMPFDSPISYDSIYNERMAREVYADLRHRLAITFPMPAMSRQQEIIKDIVRDEILTGSEEVYFTLLCYAKWRGKPVTKTVNIALPFAKFMLSDDINLDNRRSSTYMVDAYSKDFVDDEWQHNGETIVIAETGHMNDGAHRMKTCARTGRPFVSEVCVGPSRESRFCIDKGKKRTMGNTADMKGWTDGNNLMPAVNLVLSYIRHNEIGTQKFSERDRLEFLRAEPQIHTKREHRSMARHVNKATGVRMPLLWAMHYLFSRIDPTLADRLFTALRSGENLSGPMLVLRENLKTQRDDRQRQFRNKDRMISAFMIKTWNALREGHEVKQLKMGDERFPIIR